MLDKIVKEHQSPTHCGLPDGLEGARQVGQFASKLSRQIAEYRDALMEAATGDGGDGEALEIVRQKTEALSAKAQQLQKLGLDIATGFRALDVALKEAGARLPELSRMRDAQAENRAKKP